MKTIPGIFTCVAALAGIALLPGCGGGGDTASGGPRLAYVTNGVDPFWNIAEAGARKAGEDLGVDVTVLMPAGIGMRVTHGCIRLLP